VVNPAQKPHLMAPDDHRAVTEAERFWSNLATPTTTPVFALDLPLQLTLPYKTITVTTQVRLLGMKVDRFLLCDLPSHEGTSLGTTGASCTVRYLLHGRVVGFVAQVLKAQFSPEPLMFLSYPKAVSEVVLRQQERVRVNLEAVGRIFGKAERTNGVIRDLSVGGCGLYLDDETKLELGTEMTLYIKFPGEESLRKVKATIRGIRRQRKSKGVILGLSFGFDAEDLPVKKEIENLVAARSGVGSGDLIV
jgi:c-di-GMP-binding flagellar brake protein YcgR